MDAHFNGPVATTEGDQVGGGAILRVSATEQIEPTFLDFSVFQIEARAV